MDNENELARVEIVLHEFNRATIDAFLQARGFNTVDKDWDKKIKQVLLVIEEMQQGIRK